MHLYVHIPFCHHICPYCGFYKHRPGKLANAEFVDAVLAEADRRAPDAEGPLATIYFGGGTPSLLSPTHLARLCEGLAERFDLEELREWTIEANPATFDLAKAERMRSLGIDRVSLGVQSFQDEILATLGRDHSPRDAEDAFRTLRRAGFENVSMDLMFSIPGQTREHWREDLDRLVALKPDHVSAYNLTYEEDTEFLERHRSGELDTDEDRDADLFHDAIDRLEAAGFAHYEISNYARPGFESRHNRAYWSGAPYLGLGPGAVSTLPGEPAMRSTTLPDTAAYVRASLAGLDTRTEIEELSEDDLRLERVALLLRTREGIPKGWIAATAADPLLERGFLLETNTHYRLSREGKALADPIAAALV